MTNNVITINLQSQGRRLDKFLTEHLSLSRSQIQKMIKSGQVLIDQKPAAVHHFLKLNDKIEIQEKKIGVQEKKTKKQKEKPNRLFSQIKIIAEEPDFLILEKPAGLLVHPTETSKSGTLADWLIAKYPPLAKIGEDPLRPAIVHRLDKDVSGLMLIPKTQDSFDYFKQQFKLHNIIKKYLALVSGTVVKDEEIINFPISRSRTKRGLFAAHPHNHEGKKAITKFNVSKRFRNYTLLEVQILTGRTHQIRVHLLAHGHPVAGDKLYNGRLKTKNGLDRIFLHATELEFIDPAGKQWRFKSRLPKKLADFIKKLK